MPYTTEIIASTPDEALFRLIRGAQEGLARDSRNGPTLEFRGPTTVVWTNPMQRVIFDDVRDASPFFSLFESLHMFGGREDLASLLYFNSKFGQFSDDQKLIRGSAYGRRWRSWFGHDQLQALKQRVDREGITTRRMVIGQWDAATDSVADSLDVPCNLIITLLERDGKLDMSVHNRSNDVMWGCTGSNVVHFTLLHEYLCKLLEVPIGIYYQISDCMHVYTEFPIYVKTAPGILDQTRQLRTDYEDGIVAESPMFGFDLSESIEDFDADCNLFLDLHAQTLELSGGKLGLPGESLDDTIYKTTFFQEVLLPMMLAWKIRKENGSDAARNYLGEFIEGNTAPYDWHVAGYEWLDRRAKTPGRIVR